MAVEHIFIGRDGPETKTLTPVKAIRKKCLECSNFSSMEIDQCPVTDCPLYPFRFGKIPGYKGVKRVLSDEQRKEIGKQLLQARKIPR